VPHTIFSSYSGVNFRLLLCYICRTVNFDDVAALAGLPAAAAAQLPELLRHGMILTRRDSS
jgi:hypothetical protein